MNVSKLFYKLPLIADIEIIIAFLPEMLSLADQSPRDTCFNDSFMAPTGVELMNGRGVSS